MSAAPPDRHTTTRTNRTRGTCVGAAFYPFFQLAYFSRQALLFTSHFSIPHSFISWSIVPNTARETTTVFANIQTTKQAKNNSSELPQLIT
jgi:hypothetical protein